MPLLERIKQSLVVLGVPGLFLIALLDSAAVPMVGGPDGVVVLLAWQAPAQIPLIVLAATIGSTAGCWILYRMARSGGELVLSRVSPKTRQRVQRHVEQNGFLAVFLGVIAPPPFPTKPMILAAGVFHTPLAHFLAATFSGRLLRYLAMACLGWQFGDRAVEVIKNHYPRILLAIVAVAAIILGTRRLVGWRQRARAAYHRGVAWRAATVPVRISEAMCWSPGRTTYAVANGPLGPRRRFRSALEIRTFVNDPARPTPATYPRLSTRSRPDRQTGRVRWRRDVGGAVGVSPRTREGAAG